MWREVISRHRTWLLVLAVVAYACLLQGMRPLYSPDEGRYSDVALEMLKSGDWVHPMLHPEVPHWSKPPLTYWAIAASVSVFGRNELAARLPSALAFAATILLMHRLGTRFTPARPWLPALMYATLLLPSLAANLVTTDSLLALWETLQAVAFVEIWWAGDEAAARHARRLLALAAGLAFMTKGPPGLLTLLACVAFAGCTEGMAGIRRLISWDALLLFAIVGLGWYAVVVIEQPAVLRYFLVEEVVNRVASGKMRRNAQWYGPLRVYVPTLLLGTLPWLPFAVAGAWKSRSAMISRCWQRTDLRFLAVWFALPLAIFVLARSRLPLYLLPLFAPLALLMSRAMPAGLLRQRAAIAGIAAWALILILVRALPSHLVVGDDDRRLADALRRELPARPAEVAFVDTGARYGLRFYMDSAVERLDLSDDMVREESEALSEELTADEGCRVFLVEAGQENGLLDALNRHGIAHRALRVAAGYVPVIQQGNTCTW